MATRSSTEAFVEELKITPECFGDLGTVFHVVLFMPFRCSAPLLMLLTTSVVNVVVFICDDEEEGDGDLR